MHDLSVRLFNSLLEVLLRLVCLVHVQSPYWLDTRYSVHSAVAKECVPGWKRQALSANLYE